MAMKTRQRNATTHPGHIVAATPQRTSREVAEARKQKNTAKMAKANKIKDGIRRAAAAENSVIRRQAQEEADRVTHRSRKHIHTLRVVCEYPDIEFLDKEVPMEVDGEDGDGDDVFNGTLTDIEDVPTPRFRKVADDTGFELVVDEGAEEGGEEEGEERGYEGGEERGYEEGEEGGNEEGEEEVDEDGEEVGDEEEDKRADGERVEEELPQESLDETEDDAQPVPKRRLVKGKGNVIRQEIDKARREMSSGKGKGEVVTAKGESVKRGMRLPRGVAPSVTMCVCPFSCSLSMADLGDSYFHLNAITLYYHAFSTDTKLKRLTGAVKDWQQKVKAAEWEVQHHDEAQAGSITASSNTIASGTVTPPSTTTTHSKARKPARSANSTQSAPVATTQNARIIQRDLMSDDDEGERIAAESSPVKGSLARLTNAVSNS